MLGCFIVFSQENEAWPILIMDSVFPVIRRPLNCLKVYLLFGNACLMQVFFFCALNSGERDCLNSTFYIILYYSNRHKEPHYNTSQTFSSSSLESGLFPSWVLPRWWKVFEGCTQSYYITLQLCDVLRFILPVSVMTCIWNMLSEKHTVFEQTVFYHRY